jgi:hypothetical protein
MNIYSLQGKIVVTALILLLLFNQAEYKISAQKESSELNSYGFNMDLKVWLFQNALAKQQSI